MYSNILVPVAFDPEHTGAGPIEIARALASPGARITLLHVMEEVPSYAVSYMPEGYREGLKEAAVAELRAKGGDVAGIEAVVVEGHAARTILEWSEQHHVDCIVIASHRPGMADYFIGSTAARVVRHATCAVHVMR